MYRTKVIPFVDSIPEGETRDFQPGTETIATIHRCTGDFRDRFFVVLYDGNAQPVGQTVRSVARVAILIEQHVYALAERRLTDLFGEGE